MCTQWLQSCPTLFDTADSAKECSNYHAIVLISHASKIMLKILQARFQHYVNQELPKYKLDLGKAEEPEIKLPISVGS